MSKTMILALAVLVVGCSGAAANEPTQPTAPVTQGPQDQNPNDGGTVGDAGGDASATSDASDASKTPDVGSPDAGGTCATRKGGAFVTFQVGNEVLTVWSTNTKFNQEAFLASAQGKQVTPVFKKLVDGFDCDGQWT